jgi:hypothetical protein
VDRALKEELVVAYKKMQGLYYKLTTLLSQQRKVISDVAGGTVAEQQVIDFAKDVKKSTGFDVTKLPDLPREVERGTAVKRKERYGTPQKGAKKILVQPDVEIIETGAEAQVQGEKVYDKEFVQLESPPKKRPRAAAKGTPASPFSFQGLKSYAQAGMQAVQEGTKLIFDMGRDNP